MSDLSSILRLIWFPGIAQASPGANAGFRQWLHSGSIVPQAPISDATASYLIQDELANALAFDANAYAIRALETVDAITTNSEFPRASAWSAIKIYYAAFFSIQFLMRLAGRGSTFFYAADATSLKSHWGLYSVAADIRRGAYFIECDPRQRIVNMKRAPDGLGVHEAAWKGFLDFVLLLEASASQLVATDAERQRISALLGSLRAVLQRKNNNNGNWLSVERNQINYQADARMWFPYRDAPRSEQLILALDRCDLIFDSARISVANDDDAFFAACSLLFGWAYLVMNDLKLRSSGARTLFSSGVHHYLARSSLRNLRQQAAA